MPLQNHIHLSTTLGSAPENAPDLKWVITDRTAIPTVFINLKRTATGKLKKHYLTNVGGIIQLRRYEYSIKVQADFSYTLEQRVAQLEALQGKNAYLCDSFHANDGASHTSTIKNVVVAEVGEFTAGSGPGLPFFIVRVRLEDNSL